MRYIVIGASASGINGAKKLRELNEDAEIILISKDEEIYSRCILHHYISNERTVEKLDFSENNFIEKYNISWKKGVEVLKVLDSENRVELSNGEILDYDKLLICSGASSFIPPIENLREAKNVFGLRNLEDAKLIKEKKDTSKNIIVLGAGLIGIDAVSGLMKYDVNITLVEMGDRILPLQLDKEASKRYEKRFRDRGVTLKLGVMASKLIVDEDKNPKELLLNTGEKIACDMIIVATGVRANTKMLEGSGINYDKFGLIIDESGKTNIDNVYGAGDVTGRNPIWPIATKEGIVAAYNMSSIEKRMTDFFGSRNTMNFVNLTTLSLGLVNLKDDEKEDYIVEIEKDDNSYKKIIHKDGKIYGAIIQGDISYTGVLTQLIKKNIDLKKIKKPLFRVDYSDFFALKKNHEYTYIE